MLGCLLMLFEILTLNLLMPLAYILRQGVHQPPSPFSDSIGSSLFFRKDLTIPSSFSVGRGNQAE